jgi:hypothetical protein
MACHGSIVDSNKSQHNIVDSLMLLRRPIEDLPALYNQYSIVTSGIALHADYADLRKHLTVDYCNKDYEHVVGKHITP